MKGISRRTIESALWEMTKEDSNLTFVSMGNVRETEKAAYAICRKNHWLTVLVPADFEKFGSNAEFLRNGVLLKHFKPSKILMLHPEPEEESVANHILRWAKSHNAEVVHVPKPQLQAKKK